MIHFWIKCYIFAVRIVLKVYIRALIRHIMTTISSLLVYTPPIWGTSAAIIGINNDNIWIISVNIGRHLDNIWKTLNINFICSLIRKCSKTWPSKNLYIRALNRHLMTILSSFRVIRKTIYGQQLFNLNYNKIGFINSLNFKLNKIVLVRNYASIDFNIFIVFMS